MYIQGTSNTTGGDIVSGTATRPDNLFAPGFFYLVMLIFYVSVLCFVGHCFYLFFSPLYLGIYRYWGGSIVGGYLRVPAFSTNITRHHDIAEILLKLT